MMSPIEKAKADVMRAIDAHTNCACEWPDHQLEEVTRAAILAFLNEIDVEAAARGACFAWGYDWDEQPDEYNNGVYWDGDEWPARESFRQLIRAALSAIRAEVVR